MASLKFLFAFVVLIRLLLNLYDIFSFSEFIIINVIYHDKSIITFLSKRYMKEQLLMK